jgi:hypothetical protein
MEKVAPIKSELSPSQNILGAIRKESPLFFTCFLTTILTTIDDRADRFTPF